jgi:hypothetical protein
MRWRISRERFTASLRPEDHAAIRAAIGANLRTAGSEVTDRKPLMTKMSGFS